MNENHSPASGSTARERRDQAFRLRKRIALGAATGALLTVAGLGVLAEHTVAGTTPAAIAASATTVVTSGSSNASSVTDSSNNNASSGNASSSSASSNNSSSTGSASSAPSIGRGRTSIVSGGS